MTAADPSSRSSRPRQERNVGGDDEQQRVGAGAGARRARRGWRRRRALYPPSSRDSMTECYIITFVPQEEICCSAELESSAWRRLRGGDGALLAHRATSPAISGPLSRPVSASRSGWNSSRPFLPVDCLELRRSARSTARPTSRAARRSPAASLTSSRSSWLSSGGSISPWSTSSQSAKSRQSLEVGAKQQPILLGRAVAASGRRPPHSRACAAAAR